VREGLDELPFFKDNLYIAGEEFVGFFGESKLEGRIDHKRYFQKFLANAGSLILPSIILANES